MPHEPGDHEASSADAASERQQAYQEAAGNAGRTTRSAGQQAGRMVRISKRAPGDNRVARGHEDAARM